MVDLVHIQERAWIITNGIGKYGYPGGRMDNPLLHSGSAGLWPAAACVETSPSLSRALVRPSSRRSQARRSGEATRAPAPTGGACPKRSPEKALGDSQILLKPPGEELLPACVPKKFAFTAHHIALSVHKQRHVSIWSQILYRESISGEIWAERV